MFFNTSIDIDRPYLYIKYIHKSHIHRIYCITMQKTTALLQYFFSQFSNLSLQILSLSSQETANEQTKRGEEKKCLEFRV